MPERVPVVRRRSAGQADPLDMPRRRCL